MASGYSREKQGIRKAGEPYRNCAEAQNLDAHLYQLIRPAHFLLRKQFNYLKQRDPTGDKKSR